MPAYKIKRYGWKPGLPDFRHPKLVRPQSFTTPATADISAGMPPVYDQSDLGSCTANSAAALAEFLTRKLNYKDYMPSRLAIYYWTRQIEGTVTEDSGASLTDTMTVLSTKGAPNEANWPYNIAKFTNTPTAKVVANGKQHVVLDPLQVNQNMDDIRFVISNGHPIIFGFTVYESFESDAVAKTGIMPMPKRNEQIVGGHAVTIVGYDNNKKMIKVRNSWGSDWGVRGYFWMPFSYVQDPNLCDDFWTGSRITGFKP